MVIISLSVSSLLYGQNRIGLASIGSQSFDTRNTNSNFSITSRIPTGDNSSSLSGESANAQLVYNNESMTLSPSLVKSFVIFIADEAHEPPESSHKHISDHNSYFIPTNLKIAQGVSLSFLDADAPWDTPHPHTIKITDDSSGKTFTTEKLDYTNSSKPLILPAGKYKVVDIKYPWMKGTITVSSQKTSSKADLVVGGFYTTSHKVLNNKDNDGVVHPGWLGYYRNQFPINGFQILSEYSFHYAKCTYCPGGYWPDIKSADHTLFIYSTPQLLTEALSKLAKLVWDNVYI